MLNREQIRPNAFWSAVLWLMSPPVAMLAWSAFIGAPGDVSSDAYDCCTYIRRAADGQCRWQE
ncbi:hypothetical protein [Roseiflexus sp.]